MASSEDLKTGKVGEFYVYNNNYCFEHNSFKGCTAESWSVGGNEG